MAKISGINTNLRGQIGDYLFRKTKYGTIVSEAPSRKETPVRTESQMYIRTQWVNLGAVYRQFNKTLKKAYEGLGNTMSVYNAFVQANINVVKVFITKQVKANGGSVLAPYQITRGTLPSIAYEKNADAVLVTNLQLGGLVIGAETEVGELAEAIIGHNAEWESGDQLTFFYGRQTVDSVTGTPRAVIVGTKVVLDVTDGTPVWDITGSLGFASVAVSGSGGSETGGYVLGMSRAVTDGAAAWIHSREASGGDDVRVGTQSLFVDSSVLAQWQGESAFEGAAESYGGINQSAVYLDPKAIRKRGVSQQVASPVEWETISGSAGSGSSSSGNGNEETGSGGSESGSGSGSGSSGSGSGTTGGETGGTTGGGSESVSVAAPIFSGETQFTETTEVTMTAESGAEIRYTLDGSAPTAESTLYTGPVTLSDTTTVKAIAIKDGVSSTVTSRTYTKSAGNGGGGDDVERCSLFCIFFKKKCTGDKKNVLLFGQMK